MEVEGRGVSGAWWERQEARCGVDAVDAGGSRRGLDVGAVSRVWLPVSRADF